MRGMVFLAAATLALLVGCGRQEKAHVAVVPFGAAEPVRRADFVRAVAAAMKSFDDLDVPSTKIEVSAGTNGCPVLTVRSESSNNPALCANSIALALANVNLSFRGVGFMAEGERVWKILFPDDVMLPVEGPFDFGFLGKH